MHAEESEGSSALFGPSDDEPDLLDEGGCGGGGDELWDIEIRRLLEELGAGFGPGGDTIGDPTHGDGVPTGPEEEVLLDDAPLGTGASSSAEPAPKAKADPGKGRGRGSTGPRYEPFLVYDDDAKPIGHILVNEHTSSLDAHCYGHAPGDCAMSRTYTPYIGDGAMTDLRSSRGRPLGFLVAWLRAHARFPPGADGRAAHCRFGKCKCLPSKTMLGNGAGPERLAARAWVEAAPTMVEPRGAERPPRPGEPLEPPGKF